MPLRFISLGTLLLTLLLPHPVFAQDSSEPRFDQADQNGDGRITPDEVKNQRIFQRADANKDGTVTRVEFNAAMSRIARKQPQQVATKSYHQKLDIPYARINGANPNLLSLDIYQSKSKCIHPRPVVVFIHGGGWQRGDKSGGVETKAEWFTSHDYVFVSANYRLSPKVRHPAHVQDVAAAVAWVHEHIEDYCGDPDRIFVMGHSSGAHLVALLGSDSRHLEKHGLGLDDLEGVIVLDTGAVDILGVAPVAGKNLPMMWEQAFGPKSGWADPSPITHVSSAEGLPPFLLFTTEGRRAAANANDRFVDALAQRNASARHIRAEDRNHSEINRKMGTEGDTCTAEVMSFLARGRGGLGDTRIVFVTGDEEYRSEESMPMLAEILHRDYGGDIRVCYALAEDGTIDPNRLDHIEGLDAVKDADLVVLYTRFRQLPDEQLKILTDYAASGKPMVGFRTSTHAFRYPGESPHAQTMNDTWPIQVFGQKWITHHGHHGDNEQRLTDVTIDQNMRDHPVLRGVTPFQGYSWLYHVDGGGDSLPPDAQVLTMGKSLISGYSKSNRTDRFPLDQPVTWIIEREETEGLPHRVFFSTTAHPYDFREPAMRRLALNGILWSLNREDLIPTEGARTDLVGTYDPAPSGFGTVYKQGVRPRTVGEQMSTSKENSP